MLSHAPSPSRVVAVIPVRAGSKGFPGKNLAELSGRPLFQHAIDHGLDAGASQVVVTTDIPAVLEADHDPRVVMHPRRADLAGDTTPMASVLVDVLSRPEFDGDVEVVLLQATSPLRTAGDVRTAIDEFRAEGVDLLMSVCPADSGVLKYGTVEGRRFVALRDPAHPFLNRQDLPAVYRPNGAVYVFRADWFRRHGTLATDSIGVYVMPAEDSIDVDTAADLERCAQRLDERERSTA